MPLLDTYTIPQVKLEPVIAPELAKSLPALFPASVTIERGTLLGELNASPGTYNAYDHSAGDGLQVCKGIAIYKVVTDSAGKITNLGGPIFSVNSNIAIYISGYFACEDVANVSELDDAIAAGFCRLVQGTSTTGVFALGL